MAYYLQMNGTSDRIDIPSLNFTDFEIDCQITVLAAFKNMMVSPGIVDVNSFPLQLGTDGSSHLQYKVYSTVSFNGVVKPLGSVMPTTRTVFKGTMSSQGTSSSKIFCNSANGANATGNIYDIKFYNGATVVAHYDMTLGNVLDQSGNGNNATLTGGTWVSDATGTTQTGASSVQGVSTITADATVIGAITGSSSLQGVATLAATATVLNAPMLGSAALQGISTLTATGNKVQTGGASLTGVATSTVFAQGLTVLGGASLSAVGVLTASGVSGASIARAISLFGSLPSPIALLGEKVASIHLLGSFIDTIVLQGSKPSIIALEGGLMATKTNQDFTMYAGDTPPFTFTMADSTNLSGATVKWAMRKGNVKGPQVLLKTTSSGLAVSGTVGTITLLSADTISLEGKFYHEAEVTDISGIVSTVMTGIITILPSGT